MSKTPIGNIKGFGKDIFYNSFFLVGMGYLGGSMASLCNLSADTLHTIFPVDLDRSPYNGTISEMPKSRVNSVLRFFKLFPYNYIQTGDSDVSGYLNWLIYTCAYFFIGIKTAYLTIIEGGQSVKDSVLGSLFVFYVIPFILLLITLFEMIRPIMSVVAALSSCKMDQGYLFAFSLFTGWYYGLSKCHDGLTFSCIFKMIVYQIIGVILFFFVNIPWWGALSVASWVYMLVILFLSPVFHKGGISDVGKQIYKHWMSLSFLCWVLVIKSSSQYLIPEVTTGAIICTIAHILYTGYYTIYKPNKK